MHMCRTFDWIYNILDMLLSTVFHPIWDKNICALYWEFLINIFPERIGMFMQVTCNSHVFKLCEFKKKTRFTFYTNEKINSNCKASVNNCLSVSHHCLSVGFVPFEVSATAAHFWWFINTKAKLTENVLWDRVGMLSSDSLPCLLTDESKALVFTLYWC